MGTAKRFLLIDTHRTTIGCGDGSIRGWSGGYSIKSQVEIKVRSH